LFDLALSHHICSRRKTHLENENPFKKGKQRSRSTQTELDTISWRVWHQHASALTVLRTPKYQNSSNDRNGSNARNGSNGNGRMPIPTGSAVLSGIGSQEWLTRGTVTSTMRRAAHLSGCARCGASAGCSAIKYKPLWDRLLTPVCNTIFAIWVERDGCWGEKGGGREGKRERETRFHQKQETRPRCPGRPQCPALQAIE